MVSGTRSVVVMVSAVAALTIGCTYVANAEDVTTVQLVTAVKEDARLEKPVSLSARSISLKAVLDSFSAQTAVSISIDEHDPASSYTIMVECSKIPAGRMMNALYGVLSIRRGEWAWLRIGKPGAYRYSLHETPWAKNRSDLYRRILDGLLGNYLSVLRRLAPLTMDERKLHRADLKKALYVDDDMYVDFYFNNEIFWTQARFFLGALNAEQQDAVLHGSSVSVPLAGLSPDVYALFHETYLHRNPRRGNGDGTYSPVPEPASIGFSRSNPTGSQQSLAPAIVVSQGDAQVSWMGTGLLNLGVRSAIEKAWVIPGDTPTDTLGMLVVKDTLETDDTRRETASLNADLARRRSHITDSMPESVKKLLLADQPYRLTTETRPYTALLQPRIHRFALQCQYTEHAFVDTSQRLMVHESCEPLQPERELAQCERALAPEPPRPQPLQVLRRRVLGAIDDPQILLTAALDRGLHHPFVALCHEV